MAKQYVIFIEFCEVLDKGVPATQTIEAMSAGPEFNLLLQALHASPAIATLTVYYTVQGATTRILHHITHEDLGYENNEMGKLR